MTSYGHAYLTSYGWTGTGTGLRKDAIAKPLAIPPKKNLSGLGKDRDEAFPFWDHLFAAASKAITIRVSSDDEDEDNDVTEVADFSSGPHTTHAVRRTTTGILSNRRPVSGTPASTSGSATPNLSEPSRLSLLATAKREAAKRGLYARFFRGPVLGPDDECECAAPSSCASGSRSPAPTREQDEVARDTKKSKKRKSEGDAETKGERKRLKKERKAVQRAEKALGKKAREEKNQLGTIDLEDPSSKKARKRARKPSSGVNLEGEFAQEDTVLTTKKKKGKRKDTPC